MPDTPQLRPVVDNDGERDAAFAHSLDVIGRLKAVAPNPSGDAIWLLLEPKPEPSPTMA